MITGHEHAEDTMPRGRRDETYLVGSRLGRYQRSVTDSKEMQSREGNHVDSQFSQVRVENTGETQGGCK